MPTRTARTILPCLIAMHLVAGSPAAAQNAAPAPSLLEEIRVLMEEKAGRSAWGRKLDSRLYYAVRDDRGDPALPTLSLRAAELEPRGVDRVAVELDGERSPALWDAIDEVGGQIVAENGRGRVRLDVSLSGVEVLARRADVRRIEPAAAAATRRLDVTEGDRAHRADQLRAAFPVDGSGITVGVLSDGVDSLGALVASGDLPPDVEVLEDPAASGSEGTAMLEIVHDVAPGARLLFATAFGGKGNFADNIRALRAAGADVIVDDVAYFNEAVFQDDVVAAAVDEVVADGALYFSSAGNSGRVDAGTAGVWEGDFTDSGFVLDNAAVHAFAPGEVSNVVVRDAPFVYTLQWAEPQGRASSDYDLVLADAGLTRVLAASTNVQDGSQDPFEQIDSRFTDDTGARLLVIRRSGEDRFLHMNTIRGVLAIGTDGQTSGHAAARGAIGVAAVDARRAGPEGFDGSEPAQAFSSDGPRRVFFETDGRAIPSAESSVTGGELRQKPDLAAADCVSTATPGFEVFCGTSAAAPHAAAIAALLLELRPDLAQDPRRLVSALRSTALDLGGDDLDRNVGSGLIDALAASQAPSQGVPEPGTVPMGVAGMALLASEARRRRRVAPPAAAARV